MRIDRLEVQNFKTFASGAFDLHPHFTLLVGENGCGKTSVLDALAVSLGVWLVHPPDSLVRSSGRNILKTEVRLEPARKGDRIQFRECRPSHSPQVIGEVKRDEVRLFGPEGVTQPPVALGADSNWILDHVMTGAASEAVLARKLQRQAEDALAEGDLSAARSKLQELRSLLDGETGELVRMESSLHTLEALARDTHEHGAIGEDD